MKRMRLFAMTLSCVVFSGFTFAQVNAEQALNLLKEGNKRFVDGKSIRPHQTMERIKELSTGQKPYAIIVGCSEI